MLARPSIVLAGLFAAGVAFADPRVVLPRFQSAAHGGPLVAPQAAAPRASQPTTTLNGDAQAFGGGGDGFGTALTSLGDVTGDGGSDYAVSAPWAINPNGTGGLVRFFDGVAGGLWDPPATLLGGTAGEAFGYSVAGVGDVNGDGFADLLVGAPYRTSAGHPQCGRAYLYLGYAFGYHATPDWSFEVPVDGAQVGFHVAWAGDVNRDGFDDWLIAAPYLQDPESQEGAVYLFYGGGGSLSNVPAWTQEGDIADAFFGYSCSGVGDVNGDGYGDIAIGAPGVGDPGLSLQQEGELFVFAGGPGTPSHIPVKTYHGGAKYRYLGQAIAPAGDIDADGYADFLAGAPGYNDGQVGEGVAFVHFGGPSFLSLAPPIKLKKSIANARFGNSVGSAGDVNGDGYADFMIGAPDQPQVTGVGAAYLYLGNSSRAFPNDFDEFDGSIVNSGLGVSVGTIGDVNGDGRSEYATGEPSFVGAGALQIRFGAALAISYQLDLVAQGYYENAFLGQDGATADMDGDGYDDLIASTPFGGGPDGNNRGSLAYYRGGPHPFPDAGPTPLLGANPDWTYTGTVDLANLGWSVANAGDVNGDGYEDLIAGGFNYANGETGEGQAILVYGSATGPVNPPAWDVEGNEPSAGLGFAVTGGGDLDGDGFDDLAVGAPFASGGGSGRGVVKVYRGGALGPSRTPWVVLQGFQDASDFGLECTIVGDIDRDGYDDLVVGAPFQTQGEPNEGHVFVYRGSATGVHAPPSQEFQIDVANGQFGELVSRIGDVNGDGYADVAIGAPNFTDAFNQQGKVLVYYGSPAGLVASTWSLTGTQANLNLGLYNTVAGAGDYNGDGYGDMFVGWPSFDGGSGQDVGRIQIYTGGPGGLAADPLVDFEGGTPFYYLGNTGGGMADFNGDGQSDYWFSAPGYTLLSASEGAIGTSLGNLWDFSLVNPDRPVGAWRTDLLAPVGAGLRSNATNAFALKGTGRSPAGRSKMRLEYEVKPQATPFNFSGRGFGAWQSGAPVVPDRGSTATLTANATGLTTNTRYHWRARYRTNAPFLPWTPWFGSERVGSTERMITTGGYPGVIAVDPVVSGSLALVSPKPNPSFGTVALGFDLPRAGEASLVLYGVDGRRVRTLFSGPAEAGRTTLSWDGKDTAGRETPAGAYFARVSFAGEEKVGKIVRVR